VIELGPIVNSAEQLIIFLSSPSGPLHTGILIDVIEFNT